MLDTNGRRPHLAPQTRSGRQSGPKRMLGCQYAGPTGESIVAPRHPNLARISVAVEQFGSSPDSYLGARAQIPPSQPTSRGDERDPLSAFAPTGLRQRAVCVSRMRKRPRTNGVDADLAIADGP